MQGSKAKVLAGRIELQRKAINQFATTLINLEKKIDGVRQVSVKLMACMIILQEKGILTDDEIQEKYDSISNRDPQDTKGHDIQPERSGSDDDSVGGTGPDVLHEPSDSTDQGSDGDQE